MARKDNLKCSKCKKTKKRESAPEFGWAVVIAYVMDDDGNTIMIPLGVACPNCWQDFHESVTEKPN